MNQILAAIAEEQAKQNYHGNTDATLGNLHPIASSFEKSVGETVETLDRRWGGAFVYHCLLRSGSVLPGRYPDPRVHSSFAEVGAWEEYAKLPKIGRWQTEGTPEVGDLVFWTGKNGVDYVGILLRSDGETLELALGDYRNHSAIVERSAELPRNGFINTENL